MNKLRRKFTEWYVQRGYTFIYIRKGDCLMDLDGIWVCPFWVKPLLVLFSPSVYFRSAYELRNYKQREVIEID